MKNLFVPGDVKVYVHVVAEEDTAGFESGEVHAVYSTFALTRDAEWAGRLFVLEMKEDAEEGIGTAVNVQHHSPAMIGQTVTITATLRAISGNEIVTSFEAKAEGRLIASGETRQKIVTKEKLERLFASIRSSFNPG